MSEVRTLLLVHSPDVRERLVRVLDELPWARGKRLHVVFFDGGAQAAVTEARALWPTAPVGYVAPDEPTVLLALAAGADEAAVVSPSDPAELAAFVARLGVRAGMRAETERLYESFAHSEKLTALGTLVAGVGHEINNPLSAVMLSLDAARARLLPALEAAWEVMRAAEAGEAAPSEALARLKRVAQLETTRSSTQLFDDLSSATDAIASIVRDLRVFARTDEHEPLEVVEVSELIDHAVRLAGRDVLRKALLERDYAPHLPKLALPRHRITQVLVNVLVNAGHAIEEIVRPVHRIRVSARADDEHVAIAISDTGPGIAPESIERIFDPFFTTKRQDLGTGLGLSISRSILRKIGGELAVESVYQEGATFVCLLPVARPDDVRDAVRRRSTPIPASSHHGMPSVLIVDEDPHMLRAYARVLSGGHRLLVAREGREAIELLESGSHADVLLCEVDLPGIDGCELYAWLEAERPDLKDRIVFVTSGGASQDQRSFIEQHHDAVLHKPVRAADLLEAVARAAGRGRDFL